MPLVRRLVILSIVPLLVLAVPRSIEKVAPSPDGAPCCDAQASSLVALAAPSLALAHSDYPRGTRIVVYPATNAEADARLHRIHRSSFDRLQRLDGEGWVQAAVWYFHLGQGVARQTHTVTFGYAINVFRNHRAANSAMGDVKLPLQPYRVGHLAALRYSASSAQVSLEFIFFTRGPVEVETYYEYTGAAPAIIARSLHHAFSRQSSHLAHKARSLDRAIHAHPTATPTPLLVPSTPTPTPLPTATIVPSVIPSPTAVPTSTPTPRPTSTPTVAPAATPTGLIVTAKTDRSAYAPGDLASISVQVTFDNSPIAGAGFSANVIFPGHPATCSSVTDSSGSASCTVIVPSDPDGTTVPVWIQVVTSDGKSVTLPSISFTIDHTR